MGNEYKIAHPHAWVPATHEEDPNRVPGSYLRPGPGLRVAAICGLNE